MDRTLILWGSASVCAAIVFGLWRATETGAFEAVTDRVAEAAQMFSPKPQPVMVFLLPQPGTLASTAAVIEPDNLLFESETAVAYRSTDTKDQRRILALDRTSASLAVNAAGWAEHPIEIISTVTRRKRPGEASGDAAPGDDLRDLYSKPTLTRGEAMRVLAAINNGTL